MAITLDPALRMPLTRVRPIAFRPEWFCQALNTLLIGKIRPEENHLISRWLMNLYEPVVRWTLRWKWAVIGAAVAIVVLSIPIFLSLGTEFVPPLDEAAILYMPSTSPGISIAQAQELLRRADQIPSRFPEVDRVLGKAGRAETSTAPAPLSMFETVIILSAPSGAMSRLDTDPVRVTC